MIRLTVEQVKLLHSDLMSETGGLDGLRDADLLDSALNVSFQTFDDQPLYPSLQQKAARLCHSLVQNHPFVDGNKRIGVHAMLVFLSLSGVELDYMQEELIDLGLGLAAGKVSYEEVLRWILGHQQ
ncbi:Death-on-curing family protein [uncultured Eubacteriales bacterium]|uniref:Death-on-curing family protein n=1 Tax=uncultured Eubacteriales bacterium TaxID=172733 RepID=A0A212JI91_9FIRM|nr:Death-on-curing family protein [uncultured Eubacteriales bacterium]